MNNEIKQDMIKEKKYFTDRCSKGYTDKLEELSRNDADIDLTILLTKVAEKKMMLKVLAYLQAEYWYAIRNRGKVFSYKNYSIKIDEDIADWALVKLGRKNMKKNNNEKKDKNKII